jgi:membrane protein implicated in regulation of membrane protease activity
MVRYSLLRALMFFGVLSALWLAGLRSAGQRFPLVVLSALISMVLSYFVLRRFREESTQQIAAAVERRAAAREAKAGDSDEAAEDLEAEGGGPAEYR